MNKRVAPRIIGLVASLGVFLPFLSTSAQAETDYCAGHRVGYVLARCHPADRVCMRQKVRCAGHGTFKQGLKDGRALARYHQRLELRLVREIIWRNKDRK